MIEQELRESNVLRSPSSIAKKAVPQYRAKMLTHIHDVGAAYDPKIEAGGGN
jgi:CO dehydrogenase/acetyl-CoA synthase delta subunit